MIKAINLKTNQEIIVEPTRFPDGTSQVWKLPDEFLNAKDSEFSVYWEFESELEIMPILQLGQLLWRYSLGCSGPSLSVPYLPYGRQDKKVSNDATFALECFANVIYKASKFSRITTLDAHSKTSDGFVYSLPVDKYIKFAIEQSQCNLICFPDKGASNRGYNIFKKPFFCLEKVRDPITGNILNLKLENDLYNLKNKSILIVDDICDGGRTFIEAAKLLYDEGVKSVNLYVTHGIFSKGLQVLKDAKIERIFTWKGEQ